MFKDKQFVIVVCVAVGGIMAFLASVLPFEQQAKIPFWAAEVALLSGIVALSACITLFLYAICGLVRIIIGRRVHRLHH